MSILSILNSELEEVPRPKAQAQVLKLQSELWPDAVSRLEELKMLPQFQPILPEEKVVEEEEDFKYLYALSIFFHLFYSFFIWKFSKIKI